MAYLVPAASEHESRGGNSSGRRSGCLERLLLWMRSGGRCLNAMTVVETGVLLSEGGWWPMGEAGSIGGVPQWGDEDATLSKGGE